MEAASSAAFSLCSCSLESLLKLLLGVRSDLGRSARPYARGDLLPLPAVDFHPLEELVVLLPRPPAEEEPLGGERGGLATPGGGTDWCSLQPTEDGRLRSADMRSKEGLDEEGAEVLGLTLRTWSQRGVGKGHCWGRTLGACWYIPAEEIDSPGTAPESEGTPS